MSRGIWLSSNGRGCPPRNPFFLVFCTFRINRLQTASSNRGDSRAAVLGMGRECPLIVKREPRGVFRPRFALRNSLTGAVRGRMLGSMKPRDYVAKCPKCRVTWYSEDRWRVCPVCVRALVPVTAS